MPEFVKIGTAYVEFAGRNEQILRTIDQNKQALIRLAEQHRATGNEAEEQVLRQIAAFKKLEAEYARNVAQTERLQEQHVRRMGVAHAQALEYDRKRNESLEKRRRLEEKVAQQQKDQRQSNALRLIELDQLPTTRQRLEEQINTLGRHRKAVLESAVAQHNAGQVVRNTAFQEISATDRLIEQRRKAITALEKGNVVQQTGIRNDRRRTATTLGFDRSLQQVVLTLTQYAIASAVIFQLTQGFGQIAFRAGADFEQAFTGVTKTVDDVVDEFGNLNAQGERVRRGILRLSNTLPVAATELAGVTEIAGQLGIRGTQNLLSFTNVVTRLGISTNLSTQAAAFGLARLGGILGFNNPLAIGSIVTRLGNEFAATEEQILNFSLRIAPAARATGLAAQEVLGFSAALAVAGVNVEAGGTALQRLLFTMFTAIQEGGRELLVFSDLSERAVEQFRKDWSENAGQVVVDIIQNIARAPARALQHLQEVGLGDVRFRRAIVGLAASDEVVRSLATANDELARQMALIEESNRFINTFSNQWLIAKNNLTAFAVENTFLLEPMRDILKLFNDLSESGREWTAVLGGLAAAVVGFGAVAAVAALALIPFTGGLSALLGGAGLSASLFKLAAGLGIGGAVVGGAAGIASLNEGQVSTRERAYLSSDELVEEIAKSIAAEGELRKEIISLNNSIQNLSSRRGSDLPIGRVRIAELTQEVQALEGERSFLLQRRRDLRTQLALRNEIHSVDNIEQGLEIRSELQELYFRVIDESRDASEKDAEVIQRSKDALEQDLNTINRIIYNLARDRGTIDLGPTEEEIREAERLAELARQAQLARVQHIQVRRELNRENERNKSLAIQDHLQRRRELEDQKELEEIETRRNKQLAISNHLQRLRAQQFPLTAEALLEGRIPSDVSLATESERESYESYLERLVQHQENVENAARKVSQAVGSMFESWVQGTNNTREVMARLAAQLLDLALQSLVLRPLFNAIFNASPFLASLFATGGFGQPGVETGGSGYGPLGPRFQHGGYHGGGLALVGEAGPEVVDFRTPGRVYSNEDLRGALAGAGGSIVINFSPTIQSTDGPGVRRALQEALPLFEGIARNKILRDMGRPSAVRQQIRG